MGLRPKFENWFDGSLPYSTSVTTSWAAGCPLKITSTGVAICLGDDLGYLGPARTTRATAIAAGGGQCAYVGPASQVELYNNSANDANDTAPFDTSLTYAVSELLYVQAVTGLWTNVAPSGASVPRLKIVETTGTLTSRTIVANVLSGL